MAEKISYIYPEDLANLETDAEGNYIVPEGFEIYRIPTKQEKIAALQAEIERLESTPEPTNEELITWAKETHPYYAEIGELEALKERLANLMV